MQNDKEKFKNDFKKRLYSYELRLIKFVGTLNTKDVVCRVIANQLTRSGTSILANYIEGQAASSKKDFTNYFNISLKTANETVIWICLLRDSGKCNKQEANWLIEETKEFANIFGSSVLKLRGKK